MANSIHSLLCTEINEATLYLYVNRKAYFVALALLGVGFLNCNQSCTVHGTVLPPFKFLKPPSTPIACTAFIC
jgi:hypothetical protein